MPTLVCTVIVLHIVAIIILRPFSVTTMEFDRQEEEQRTEEVKKREAIRLAEVAARRELIKLHKPDAEKMKAEEIKKRQPQLKKNLAELREAKREIEKLRDKKFEELSQRKAEDIARFRARDLMRKASELEQKAKLTEELAKVKRPEAGRLSEAVKALKAKIAEAGEKPEDITKLADDVVDAATEVARIANDNLKADSENHRRRHELKQVEEMATALAKDAKVLADQPIDTAKLNAVPEVPPTSVDSPEPTSPSEAYAEAVKLEEEIQEAFNQAKAAETALGEGTSFAEARKQPSSSSPSRPDLASQLESGTAETIADMDRQRETLDKAVAETASMAMRARNLESQAKGQAKSPGQESNAQSGELSSGQSAARAITLQQAVRTQERGRVVNLAGLMGGTGSGTGSGEESLRGAFDGVGMLDPTRANLRIGDRDVFGGKIQVNPDTFGSETLPGRMITDESERKGWLYIDTWYLIGPWENDGELQFSKTHAPESIIDLDATYSDGKFAEQADHPLRELKWEFYQSDQVRCQPPEIFSNSTYYAYTELFSDRDREVLFTISTDDAAKVWLNDQLIWEDIGGSPWQVGEGFRRVKLNSGYNRLLVRIENGPLYCVWSVLFCPTSLEETASAK